MPRGRAPNIPRAEARTAGLKTYADGRLCLLCGCPAKYTSNAQCVDCTIQKGRERYAALEPRALAALKAKDRERYLRRIEEGRQP